MKKDLGPPVLKAQLSFFFEMPARAADPSDSASAAGASPEARAGRLFLQAAQERRRTQMRSVRVEFRPFRSTLYSYRIKPNGAALVQFHAVFRDASDEVLLQAAHLMLCRTRPARRNIPREAYDAFVRAIPPESFEMPGARKESARARPGPGEHRSLDESFQRVNAMYFEGKLAKPSLCWSPRRSRRLLGSYHERKDRVIVSRLFDSERVPIFLLDYIMYHELLHKHLGVGKRSDGRRCVHSAEFRRLERKYIRFEEVLALLKRL
ncbi:MAG: hypothetical protein KIS92_07695 [Planctomycetota bacterium]|nr:hypothetical protein [Planctomycetota bacterium]